MVEYLVGDLLNRVGLLADLAPDARARLADLLRPARFPPACDVFAALDVGVCVCEREREREKREREERERREREEREKRERREREKRER